MPNKSVVISEEWLKEKSACQSGVNWFLQQKETDGLEVVKKLIAEKQLLWANWLIVRIMDYKEYVSYAVFAAEQVIDIYEKQYPEDNRPRKAIEAAKMCIDNPNEKNKTAAGDAAWAAAGDAAWDAAGDAAWAAAWAAAGDAAWAAAGDAAWAAAGDAMRLKILEYGIKLLEDK